jgi:hypothetical protein
MLRDAMQPPIPSAGPCPAVEWTYRQVLDNAVEIAFDLIHDPDNEMFQAQWIISIDVLRAITHAEDMDCADRVLARAWRILISRRALN